MMHVDMLPFELHRRRRILSALKRWSIAASVIAGLFLLAYLVENRRLQRVTEAVEQREQQFQPIVAKRDEIKTILKQLESMRSREAIAVALEDRYPVLTLVGNVGLAASTTDGTLNVQSLGFDRTLADRQVATINGQVVDHLGMAKFLAALRASNLFVSVDPKWVKANDNGTWTIQSFEVECYF